VGALRFRHVLVVVFVLILVTAGCGSARRTEEAKKYKLSGRVVALDAASKQVVIAHQAIPGYVDATTMGFPLKDPRDLDRLRPNDQVEGWLYVELTRSYLEIESIVHASEGAGESPQPAKSPSAGTLVPDIPLVNQDARKLRLSSFRGKTVVLTFIYTRCPLPDFCPRMNQNFARIAEALDKEPSARERIELLTISFDPAYDTPEVLKKHRARYRRTESPTSVPWDFVTGTPEDIRKLADFFGLFYQGTGLDTVHTLRTAVVDKDGKVVRVFEGNSWTPEDVLAELKGR